MSVESAGSTFEEVQLQAVLLGQGFSKKLARQVAEARIADARFVAEKRDRKTLRRRTQTD